MRSQDIIIFFPKDMYDCMLIVDKLKTWFTLNPKTQE